MLGALLLGGGFNKIQLFKSVYLDLQVPHSENENIPENNRFTCKKNSKTTGKHTRR